jgi:glycosyltransferase involved in cell wall biosynthesis
VRVMHVSPSFARRDGGPSETLRGLIPELRAVGIEIHTLTTDKGIEAQDMDFVEAGGVTLVRSRKPRSWNFAPGILLPLWQNVKKFDAVHIHSVHSFTSTITMIIARARRVPYIVEPHGALDSYHMQDSRRKKIVYNRLVDAWGFAGLGGVLTSSSRERVDSQRALRAPHFDMPLGVDEALFGIDRAAVDRVQMLFLGRVVRKKRLDVALKALSRIPARSRPTFVIAGPIGDDLDYDPVALVGELGLSNDVRFVGTVNAESRATLLAESALFVLPSEDESFGVAVAEAMAAGCCVIATPQVGIAQDAANAGALVLATVDPNGLAEIIAAYTRDTDKAKIIGERARHLAYASFRWSIAARYATSAYRAIQRTRERGP